MRCLLVYDDEASCDSISRFVKKNDKISVLHQSKGVENAIRDFAKYTFDLVIIDISVPKEADIKLLKWIRGENINAGVIFVTRESSVDYVRRVFGYGVCDYIIKPFLFKRFGEAVDRAASKRSYLNSFKFMNQSEIDHLLALTVDLEPDNAADKKGISVPTMKRVEQAVESADGRFTANSLAKKTGLSRITVRRYLERLVEKGMLGIELEYGEVGRPQKVYQKKKSFKDDK